ncbi:hypothetical protein CRM22_007928 [Opisthorchis felineus]|uniref:Uncharacterized protein n=1 Tax=Opisthorchis felineus TaxID=147828 RepID=A0A4S2LLI0_OPIFE|nr:hypothetical protein CRM22_007928 [Opisthorchis felineus]
MINPPKRSYNFNTGLGCFTNSSSTAVSDTHSATLYSPMTTAIAGRQVNTTHLTTRPSSLPAYAGGINDGAPFVDREVSAMDTTLDLFCRRTGGISSPFSIGGPSSPLGLLISQTELNYCDARSTSTLATPPAAYGQELPDEHEGQLLC